MGPIVPGDAERDMEGEHLSRPWHYQKLCHGKGKEQRHQTPKEKIFVIFPFPICFLLV